MANAREELEFLRKLKANQTPRDELNRLRALQSEGVTIPEGPISTDIQIPRTQERDILADRPLPPTLGNVATMASGIVAEPVAGLAGLASLPFGAEQAAKNVETVRGALTIPPQSAADVSGLKTVGRAAQPAADVIGSVEQAVGDVGFDVAGPVGGAIGEALPTLAASILGLRLPSSGKTSKDSSIFRNETPVKKAIRESIEKNPTDNKTAKFMIDGAGQVKADPIAKSVIKQGFDEGVVAAVKGSSKQDVIRMREMIDIVEKGKANRTFFLKNRPEDVVGKTILDRWSSVRDINKKAGSELDNVAKSLQGQKVNLGDATETFFNDLENLGVSVDSSFKTSFSDLSVGDIPAAKSFIQRIVKNLSLVKGDAFKAHRLKKLIDEQVSFGKAGEGITGKTESIIKNLRRNVDQSLDGTFVEYNDVNTRFADTKQALDDFRDAAGAKNFNPYSETADKFVGVLSRRLLSNVQSRSRLMDSLTGLERSASTHGVEFSDDIFTQAMFADELENVFGSFAPKSLQGVTEKAILEAGRDVKGGVVDLGIKAAAKGAEKLRGINDENAIKSLKELLKRSKK